MISDSDKAQRIQVAQKLIARKWRLILLLCGVKVPVKAQWQVFKSIPPAKAFGISNCGVLTDDEFFVLDIDVKPGAPNGHHSLKLLTSEFGRLPDTLHIATPSGGAHFYFKHPKTHKVPCKKLSWNGQFLGCETKGVGGFVACPPSKLDNGSYEFIDCDETTEIAEAPQWLLDLCAPSTTTKRALVESEQSQDRDHVMSLLGHVSPDVGYDEWLKIGMALHSSGEPWAYDVWLEWSRTGRKFRSEHDLKCRWDDFKPTGGVSMGTFFHICSQYIEEPERVYSFETAAIAPRILEEPSEVRQKKSSELFKEVIDKSSGILRELNDYFYQTSVCPDYPFTFAAAVTLCHFATQDNFVTFGGDILHQYTICDGASAGGKTSSFSQCKKLAAHLHAKACLKHPTSLKGLINEFADHTSRVWIFDEWGGPEVIKAFKGEDKHQGEIYRQALLGLWSSADQIEGTSQADRANNAATVNAPRLSVLFSTQSDTVEKISATAFYRSSGFARRVDIFKGDSNPMPRDVDSQTKKTATENIIYALLDWKAWLDGQLPTGEFHSKDCHELSMEPSVLERRHLLRVSCHEKAQALVGENDTQVQILKTAVQKCTRWATVHALSRKSRVVAEQDWDYAMRLFDAVHHSFNEMESGLNSPYEKARTSVIRVLSKKALSARELQRASTPFRMLEKQEQKTLINDLLENGEVVASKQNRKVVLQAF